MSFIVIYVTHKNALEAKRVGEHLLRKKLVACVNYFPINSSYLWKGGRENTREIVTLLKTSKSNWLKVKSEIEKIHPYEVPCIMKYSVEANKAYEDWIKKETR